MAMKKANMEVHYDFYKTSMTKARECVDHGLFAEAMKCAFEAWEHIDGMMQYARKYKNHEFDTIEAIDYVLKYAPFLFDFESLDTLEAMLKSCKRIEKNTDICIADRLSEAHGLMAEAHKFWNYLEHNPQIRQDRLAEVLGGEQDQWRYIAESWARMGLLTRQKEGNSYQLNLRTRMGAVTRAKCPKCGSHQEAPKAMLLEATMCPDCGENVYFVILS